jgi:hypothetical protein
VAQLRTLLGYSDEHPLFGIFELPRERAEVAERAFGVALDFDRFDYSVDTTG